MPANPTRFKKGNAANATSFKRGQSGNPGGKPVGARNRISNRFLIELANHFESLDPRTKKAKGYDAIERVWKKHPDKYIAACSSLVPREMTAGLIGEDGEPVVSSITVTFIKPSDGG